MSNLSAPADRPSAMSAASVTVEPATPDRWDDVVALFDRKPGEAGKCWCIYFRLPRPEFEALTSGDRRSSLRELVESGAEPGLLAYEAGEPVGWVSVAPRTEFEAHLQRTRVLKPVPGDGVWTVPCFVVRKDVRRRGIATRLLDAAGEHARRHGARSLEGYPIDTATRRVDGMVVAWELYVGTTTMFAEAGFREVARRGKRPVYRRDL